MYIIYYHILYVILGTSPGGKISDTWEICYASSSPYNSGVVDGNTIAGFETDRRKYPSPAKGKPELSPIPRMT